MTGTVRPGIGAAWNRYPPRGPAPFDTSDTGNTVTWVRDGQRERVPALDGVRAVAILLVLMAHLRIGPAGGVLGVDVFLVLSGYLITRSALLGGGYLEFLRRRARRILPLYATVTTVTVLAAAWFLPTLAQQRLAREIPWISIFAGNVAFETTGTEYLQGPDPSPLLHLWSLAVEEQFYLLWIPALLLARRAGRRAALGLTAIGFVASLLYALVADPSWYSTPGRGWELLAGSLLALTWAERRTRGAFTVLGLGVLTGAVLFSPLETAGVAALPVAGATVLLILASRTRLASALLGNRPLSWVGARSYGIYLWHWPLWALLTARTGDLPTVGRVGVAAAAVLLGALTHGPLERAPLRTRRSIVAVGFLAFAILLPNLASTLLDRGTAGTGQAQPELPRTGTVEELLAAANQLAMTTVETNAPPPAALRPEPADAAADQHEALENGCMAGIEETAARICRVRTAAGGPELLLYGDSHVVQWLPGVLAAQPEAGVSVLAKAGCTPLPLRRDFLKGAPYPECMTWRDRAERLLASTDADLILLASMFYVEPQGPDMPGWADAYRRMLTDLETTAPVVLLGDSAAPFKDIPGCLSANPAELNACTHQLTAVAVERERIETQAAEAAGIPRIPLLRWTCAAERCPPVLGNIVVYADGNHVTATFAEASAGLFAAIIAEHAERR